MVPPIWLLASQLDFVLLVQESYHKQVVYLRAAVQERENALGHRCSRPKHAYLVHWDLIFRKAVPWIRGPTDEYLDQQHENEVVPRIRAFMEASEERRDFLERKIREQMEYFKAEKQHYGYRAPHVVIHCGDITGDSRLSEYRDVIQVLQQIDAPVKLIIAGNHDYTLDTPTYEQMISKSRKRKNLHKLYQCYGDPGAARQILEEVRQLGILYLDEGTHRIPLANGALLTVYASPYTPAYGTPGFQYTTKQSHDFAIPSEADVVVSHGPPWSVLDRSWMTGKHVGSPELFTAVARARPKLHCFGHIHEGWGAEMVTWRDGNEEHHTSTLLADLRSILPLKGDAMDVVREKERKLGEYARGKCVKTSHCAGDVLPVRKGVNTLFVNAAVVGTPTRPAWVVDVELPAMDGGDAGR
ncbi:hypothetical protein VTI74DRAFT_8831 [Chaetomium olivicolor]